VTTSVAVEDSCLCQEPFNSVRAFAHMRVSHNHTSLAYLAPSRCAHTCPNNQLVARRRGLAAVSKTLRAAAANLRATAGAAAHFNREMMDLSRGWRLRTVGDVLLCDFGNRAIGGGYVAQCEAEVVGDVGDTPGSPTELRLLIPAQFRAEVGLMCLVGTLGDAAHGATTPSRAVGLQLRPPPGSDGWRAVVAVANRAAFATELFAALRRDALAWHGGVAAEDSHSFTVNLHEPAAMTLELGGSAGGTEEGTSSVATGSNARGTELGGVLALTMAMRLRRLQRAHAVAGRSILEEAARLATTECTRSSVVRVMVEVATQVRDSCALSRLTARWDVNSPPWAPLCEVTFSSRDAEGELTAHRRVVELTVGRGSYSALDRRGSSAGVRQFFPFTEDALRAFLVDQWRRQQMDVVRSEAAAAGFVIEHRAGLGASTVAPPEHALRHASRGVSLRLRRDGSGGEVIVNAFVNDDAVGDPAYTCAWSKLPGRSPRQRFYAALRAVTKAE
jgi:hypothetical protein